MTTVAPAQPQHESAADEVDGPRRRRVTWRSVLFTLVLVPAVLAVPVLGYMGATILRDEDTGQVLNEETDVTAPGFEALVSPTPTQMVVMLDSADRVAGVQVAALTAPSGGGTVVAAPVSTHLEVAFLDTPTKSLDDIYELAGVDGLEQRMETVFSAGMGEVVQVTPDQWPGLIEPLGGITVDNPMAFTGVRPDGTVTAAFNEGPVTLLPDQVADFLLYKGEGELDTVRNDRQIAFWQAWIDAVAEQGPDAVPGETDLGLGRFVRGLAAGSGSVVQMPVDQVPIPGVAAVDSNLFLPNQDEVDALSLRIVPFPVGVDRVRTRLIDGVGDVEGLKARAASLLVASGAEITVIGNATEYGQELTTVVYFRADDQVAAQALADALGGRIERGDSTNETVDVVVVLGRDFADSDVEAQQSSDSGVIEVVPPTSVPIGADGTSPGIAPGAPGGDPLG